MISKCHLMRKESDYFGAHILSEKESVSKPELLTSNSNVPSQVFEVPVCQKDPVTKEQTV